jgi:diacylglycerol kinase
MTTGPAPPAPPAPPLPTLEGPTPGPTPGHADTLRAGFGYAFAGLAYCFRTQRNFRIHISIAIVATVVGLLLGLTWVEWAVLAVTVALVLSAEVVNTMIEALVDLVTAEYHPLAKVAKDVAAGVVLLTAMGAVVVGLVIFGPRLLAAIR